jgi:hypothetical protein
MSFYKRVKENTDERYHKYLPEGDQNELQFQHIQGEDGKESSPDAAIINDKLSAKATSEELKEYLEGPQS